MKRCFFQSEEFMPVLFEGINLKKFYELKTPGTYRELFIGDRNLPYIFASRAEVERFRRQHEALILRVTMHGTRLHLAYNSPIGMFEVVRIFQKDGKLRSFESNSDDSLFWPIAVARHVFLLS